MKLYRVAKGTSTAIITRDGKHTRDFHTTKDLVFSREDLLADEVTRANGNSEPVPAGAARLVDLGFMIFEHDANNPWLLAVHRMNVVQM